MPTPVIETKTVAELNRYGGYDLLNFATNEWQRVTKIEAKRVNATIFFDNGETESGRLDKPVTMRTFVPTEEEQLEKDVMYLTLRLRQDAMGKLAAFADADKKYREAVDEYGPRGIDSFRLDALLQDGAAAKVAERVLYLLDKEYEDKEVDAITRLRNVRNVLQRSVENFYVSRSSSNASNELSIHELGATTRMLETFRWYKAI